MPNDDVSTKRTIFDNFLLFEIQLCFITSNPYSVSCFMLRISILGWHGMEIKMLAKGGHRKLEDGALKAISL